MQSWLFHVQEGARKAFVNIVARKSRCSSREVATASLKESYVCEKKSAIKSHHTGRQWVRNSSTVLRCLWFRYSAYFLQLQFYKNRLNV